MASYGPPRSLPAAWSPKQALAAVLELADEDPARAALLWTGVEAVANGLGDGSGEVLGGVFTLVTSIVMLRAPGWPRALGIIGTVVGVIGLCSAVPGLYELGGAFGVTQIVWFVGIGVVLL